MSKDVLNKGIPIPLPRRFGISYKNILECTKNKEDKEKLKELFDKTGINNVRFLDSIIEHGSYRYLRFHFSLSVIYNKERKMNEFIMEPSRLLRDIMKYLNIDDKKIKTPDDGVEKTYDRLRKLSNIINEQKLKRFFPKLHELYLKERKKNEEFTKHLKDYGRDILENSVDSVYNDIKRTKYEIEDTLKINKVENFCKIYSKIIENIMNKYDEVYNHYISSPIDIFKNYDYDEEKLATVLVCRFLDEVDISEKEDKQKYLYYATWYINNHKHLLDSNKEFEIDGKKLTYIDIYNRYINILINNVGLKVVNYEREYFDYFTAEEVEEYMEEELSTSTSNWHFLEEDDEIERVAHAIRNSTKHMKDETDKIYEQEKLKKLFIRKKELFEKSGFYKVVEGSNSFDGYIAYIYNNGKVILEKFFERGKNSERIATESAIYIMNIEDFYSMSKLSRTKIMKEKLCHRIIHSGSWEEKVKQEIESAGISPREEYKKLVLENKIKDNTFKKYNT